MNTPKISIWAFNEFTAFDALIANLGCAPQKAEDDYSRTNKVKMVNTTHDFKHDLSAFLDVLAITLPEADMATVRGSIFKKNGEMRKLAGKEVKLQGEGFFINIEF
ncbi:hypothetical protein AB4U81_003555 [Salmonella enterica]|nr:hypothetical protein [Salmonella enterica subsp. enterica]QPX73994.1 hypothetical protein [Salmonella phage AR2819]QPX74565.1 hypothetical protein Sajous1_162 [Salmonella phage Sajous1]